MTLMKRVTWPSDPFFEMDRLFDRAFGSRALWPESVLSAATRNFPLDVYGDDERYYVVAELPGVTKDAIDLNVENGVLTVNVRKTDTFDGEEGERVRRFSRGITVGDDIDVDNVTAKLENGILTVTLPKAEERKPRKIAIK